MAYGWLSNTGNNAQFAPMAMSTLPRVRTAPHVTTTIHARAVRARVTMSGEVGALLYLPHMGPCKHVPRHHPPQGHRTPRRAPAALPVPSISFPLFPLYTSTPVPSPVCASSHASVRRYPDPSFPLVYQYTSPPRQCAPVPTLDTQTGAVYTCKHEYPANADTPRTRRHDRRRPVVG